MLEKKIELQGEKTRKQKDYQIKHEIFNYATQSLPRSAILRITEADIDKFYAFLKPLIRKAIKQKKYLASLI